MPLAPSDHQGPTRRLERSPGLWGLVPVAIGIGALLFLGVGFTMCANLSRTVESSGPPSEVERGMARVQGQLNTRDALIDASAAQKEHFSSTRAYTSDVGVLTARGSYVGVQLAVFLERPDEYCMEALHQISGIVKHITERDDRPRRGSCPAS